MSSAASITIWMGDNIPERFRQLEWLSDCTEGEDPNGAISKNGQIVVFLADVPAAVLASRVYQQGNWPEENHGWLPDGGNGLFGTNAIEAHPHPEGDGVLIVGSAV